MRCDVCGHDVKWHGVHGCMFYDEDNMLFTGGNCSCEMTRLELEGLVK